MDNVHITVSPDGKKATIVVDLTKRLGPSKSGLTVKVASTHGNRPVGDSGVILGLNAYVKP